MWNDSDKLDHLIALAASGSLEAEAKELENMDISSVSLSPAYCRKRAKMIRKYKRPHAFRMPKSVSVRIAAAIIIIAAVFTVLISCMPGLGKAIYNAIVEWYDEYFTVRYESGQEQETAYSESSTPAPAYITEIRKPQNLPESIRENVVSQTSSKINLDYYVGDEYVFSFSQFVLYPFDQYADSDDIEVANVKFNGFDATVVKHKTKKEINIFWNDREYSYHIFSNECDFESLLKYAKSVK